MNKPTGIAIGCGVILVVMQVMSMISVKFVFPAMNGVFVALTLVFFVSIIWAMAIKENEKE